MNIECSACGMNSKETTIDTSRSTVTLKKHVKIHHPDWSIECKIDTFFLTITWLDSLRWFISSTLKSINSTSFNFLFGYKVLIIIWMYEQSSACKVTAARVKQPYNHKSISKLFLQWHAEFTKEHGCLMDCVELFFFEKRRLVRLMSSFHRQQRVCV